MIDHQVNEMNGNLNIDKARLEDFCRKHSIRKLSFFGSVLRDDFGPGSDVDVLAEFEPGTVTGFFKLHDVEQELSELLSGRKVDVHTPKGLSPYLRERVLDEAEVMYVSA